MAPEEGGIKLHTDQRVFLRAGARFFSEHGCFVRGYGKCVAGDTVLFTGDGQKEIGEYFGYQADGQEHICNQYIMVVNREGNHVISNRGIYSGYKPTKKITTKDGYSLECTYVHPILVLDTDGKVKFKRAADLHIGDKAVINRKNNLYGNSVYIPCDNKLKKWMDTLSAHKKSQLNIRPMPNILTEELAYAMGIITSNGWFVNDKVVEISEIDSETSENYRFCIKVSFDADVKLEGLYNDVISDAYLIQYLRILGLDNVDFCKRCVPDIILSAPRSAQLNFIRGLFDANGYVKNVMYRNVSRKLVKQLQLMLLNIGIVSQLKKGQYDSPSYYLYISEADLPLFEREIGFSNVEKERLLSEAVQKNNIKIQNYYYSEISEIGDGMNHVYDLQVPDTSSFVSNGFVSHNTFLEVANMMLACIRYPNIELALTAQTKENAALLLWDKYNEIVRYYPMMKNEIAKTSFTKNEALIIFKNNVKIDSLSNLQNSKGQRRKRISMEESNLVDNVTFEDALEPIVEIGRTTCGKLAIVNPEELNQPINFYTTPG